MRSNELRIGNYAMDKVLGIIGIDSTDKIYHAGNLKPIPLTEEWLVKFGFERSTKTFTDSAYSVTFRRAKDGGWAIYDTSTDEGTNYLTPNLGFCEHVHQLQNLYFALTGEELTIKE
jgi:hypothetical protein